MGEALAIVRHGRGQCQPGDSRGLLVRTNGKGHCEEECCCMRGRKRQTIERQRLSRRCCRHSPKTGLSRALSSVRGSGSTELDFGGRNQRAIHGEPITIPQHNRRRRGFDSAGLQKASARARRS